MKIRSNIYEALKKDTIEILDIGVPPNLIAKYVQKVKDIEERQKVDLPTFGHAGDGNVHTHIMKYSLGIDWKDQYRKIKKELFETAKQMGGVITAEHGIGVLKIPDLHYTLSGVEINLMYGIKKLFDPNNIMNPGKVIDRDIVRAELV
jgi:glycolate oxidase